MPVSLDFVLVFGRWRSALNHVSLGNQGPEKISARNTKSICIKIRPPEICQALWLQNKYEFLLSELAPDYMGPLGHTQQSTVGVENGESSFC